MTIIWADYYIRFEKWDSKLPQSSNLFVVTAVDLSYCWLERHCILLSIVREKRVWSFTYVGYEFNVPVNSTQIGLPFKVWNIQLSWFERKRFWNNATCALKDDQIKMPSLRGKKYDRAGGSLVSLVRYDKLIAALLMQDTFLIEKTRYVNPCVLGLEDAYCLPWMPLLECWAVLPNGRS